MVKFKAQSFDEALQDFQQEHEGIMYYISSDKPGYGSGTIFVDRSGKVVAASKTYKWIMGCLLSKIQESEEFDIEPLQDIKNNPEAPGFRAIAHIYFDDPEGGEFYVDSYPLMEHNKKEARRIFKSLGFDVSKPWAHIYVDSIEAFIFDGGSMTMDDFQKFTGLDLVTWIWGVGPFPRYVLNILGGSRPADAPLSEYDPVWARRQWDRMTRSRTLLEAIEKSLLRRKDQLTALFWSVSTDLSRKLRRPGEERNLFMWLVDVFKESDLDIYK